MRGRTSRSSSYSRSYSRSSSRSKNETTYHDTSRLEFPGKVPHDATPNPHSRDSAVGKIIQPNVSGPLGSLVSWKFKELPSSLLNSALKWSARYEFRPNGDSFEDLLSLFDLLGCLACPDDPFSS